MLRSRYNVEAYGLYETHPGMGLACLASNVASVVFHAIDLDGLDVFNGWDRTIALQWLGRTLTRGYGVLRCGRGVYLGACL